MEGRNGYAPFPTDSQSVMLLLHHRPINWRVNKVSIPIQLLTVSSVFKTVAKAASLNHPKIKWRPVRELNPTLLLTRQVHRH